MASDPGFAPAHAGLPGPEAAVPLLEQLAGARRGRRGIATAVHHRGDDWRRPARVSG